MEPRQPTRRPTNTAYSGRRDQTGRGSWCLSDDGPSRVRELAANGPAGPKPGEGTGGTWRAGGPVGLELVTGGWRRREFVAGAQDPDLRTQRLALGLGGRAEITLEVGHPLAELRIGRASCRERV